MAASVIRLGSLPLAALALAGQRRLAIAAASRAGRPVAVALAALLEGHLRSVELDALKKHTEGAIEQAIAWQWPLPASLAHGCTALMRVC